MHKNFAETQHKPKPKKKTKKSVPLHEFVKPTAPAVSHTCPAVEEEFDIPTVKPILEEAKCSICHDLLADVTASTNCNHTFCHDCISEWTSNYLSTCPLCKTKVTSLTKHDKLSGTKDEKQIPYVSNLLSFDPNELSQREIFACLDHNYFLQEITSLLSTADRIIDQLRPSMNAYRSYYKLSTPQKSASERRWKSVHEVKNTLQSMATEFKYLKEFDPSSCLEQLYAVNEELKQLQESAFSPVQEASPNAKKTTIRFDPFSNKIEMYYDEDEMYADEMAAMYEEEEYYDYDEEDEYHSCK